MRNGTTASQPVTRATGAISEYNAFSWIMAASSAPYPEVRGASWKLVLLVREGAESTPAADAVPTLTIEEGGKVHGLATLNRYFGQVEIGDSGRLAWSAPLGSTMMAGPEPLMDQETAFLQALQATRKLSLREGRLVLEDDTGRTRLEFER